MRSLYGTRSTKIFNRLMVLSQAVFACAFKLSVGITFYIEGLGRVKVRLNLIFQEEQIMMSLEFAVYHLKGA